MNKGILPVIANWTAGALLLLVLIVGLTRGLWVDQNEAVQALTNLGFSQVQITGRHWFLVGFQGCSSDDAAKFDATAVNPAGRQVKVYVCIGWPFKGATVRSSLMIRTRFAT